MKLLLNITAMNFERNAYDIPIQFKKLNTGPFPTALNMDDRGDGKHIEKMKEKFVESSTYLDPMCHYNISSENIFQSKQLQTQIRLIGSIRKDFILSPFSSICLSPFIWRAGSINPPWLQLMDELKFKVNWKLEARATLDFTYVQPNYIPTLNSLCHQFFWNGINLTETLQYPEYTCIAIYKKLIVGFVCVVPKVNADDIYLSFIFTMPAWRNCGIAKFMLYHIIQVSGGKNITLHVSTSNPALFLFQKYGFKIQYVVKNFYEKYLSSDSTESRHSFFCKLYLED